MLSLSYLSERIRSWAVARNIVDGATQKDQFIKLNSEFGELCITLDHLDYCAPEEKGELMSQLKDDIGDNYVVLTILAAQQKVNIEDLKPEEVTLCCDHVKRLASAYGKLGDLILKGASDIVPDYIEKALGHLKWICIDHDMDFNTCIAAAYADIKDRRGVMYHGAFVKSTDTRYEACCAEIGVKP